MTPFYFFLVLGVVLLATELVVFQMSVFWLFFIGCGALVAAAFAWLTSATGFVAATGVFVIVSALLAVLLLRPLKNWQDQSTGLADNNALGQQVKVTRTITAGSPGNVTWSGTEWPARLAAGVNISIASGDMARVVSVDGIDLLVEPLLADKPQS